MLRLTRVRSATRAKGYVFWRQGGTARNNARNHLYSYTFASHNHYQRGFDNTGNHFGNTALEALAPTDQGWAAAGRPYMLKEIIRRMTRIVRKCEAVLAESHLHGLERFYQMNSRASVGVTDAEEYGIDPGEAPHATLAQAVENAAQAAKGRGGKTNPFTFSYAALGADHEVTLLRGEYKYFTGKSLDLRSADNNDLIQFIYCCNYFQFYDCGALARVLDEVLYRIALGAPAGSIPSDIIRNDGTTSPRLQYSYFQYPTSSALAFSPQEILNLVVLCAELRGAQLEYQETMNSVVTLNDKSTKNGTETPPTRERGKLVESYLRLVRARAASTLAELPSAPTPLGAGSSLSPHLSLPPPLRADGPAKLGNEQDSTLILPALCQPRSLSRLHGPLPPILFPALCERLALHLNCEQDNSGTDGTLFTKRQLLSLLPAAQQHAPLARVLLALLLPQLRRATVTISSNAGDGAVPPAKNSEDPCVDFTFDPAIREALAEVHYYYKASPKVALEVLSLLLDHQPFYDKTGLSSSVSPFKAAVLFLVDALLVHLASRVTGQSDIARELYGISHPESTEEILEEGGDDEGHTVRLAEQADIFGDVDSSEYKGMNTAHISAISGKHDKVNEENDYYYEDEALDQQLDERLRRHDAFIAGKANKNCIYKRHDVFAHASLNNEGDTALSASDVAHFSGMLSVLGLSYLPLDTVHCLATRHYQASKPLAIVHLRGISSPGAAVRGLAPLVIDLVQQAYLKIVSTESSRLSSSIGLCTLLASSAPPSTPALFAYLFRFTKSCDQRSSIESAVALLDKQQRRHLALLSALAGPAIGMHKGNDDDNGPRRASSLLELLAELKPAASIAKEDDDINNNFLLLSSLGIMTRQVTPASSLPDLLELVQSLVVGVRGLSITAAAASGQVLEKAVGDDSTPAEPSDRQLSSALTETGLPVVPYQRPSLSYWKVPTPSRLQEQLASLGAASARLWGLLAKALAYINERIDMPLNLHACDRNSLVDMVERAVPPDLMAHYATYCIHYTNIVDGLKPEATLPGLAFGLVITTPDYPAPSPNEVEEDLQAAAYGFGTVDAIDDDAAGGHGFLNSFMTPNYSLLSFQQPTLLSTGLDDCDSDILTMERGGGVLLRTRNHYLSLLTAVLEDIKDHIALSVASSTVVTPPIEIMNPEKEEDKRSSEQAPGVDLMTGSTVGFHQDAAIVIDLLLAISQLLCYGNYLGLPLGPTHYMGGIMAPPRPPAGALSYSAEAAAGCPPSEHPLVEAIAEVVELQKRKKKCKKTANVQMIHNNDNENGIMLSIPSPKKLEWSFPSVGGLESKSRLKSRCVTLNALYRAIRSYNRSCSQALPGLPALLLQLSGSVIALCGQSTSAIPLLTLHDVLLLLECARRIGGWRPSAKEQGTVAQAHAAFGVTNWEEGLDPNVGPLPYPFPLDALPKDNETPLLQLTDAAVLSLLVLLRSMAAAALDALQAYTNGLSRELNGKRPPLPKAVSALIELDIATIIATADGIVPADRATMWITNNGAPSLATLYVSTGRLAAFLTECIGGPDCCNTDPHWRARDIAAAGLRPCHMDFIKFQVLSVLHEIIGISKRYQL